MPLDVRADHLEIVLAILMEHIPDRNVMAFGSRVTGQAKKTSDLDLVVMGDEPLDFTTLGLLRDAFSESNIPYKVDVVVWATTSASFRKIIERDAVVIREPDETGDRPRG